MRVTALLASVVHAPVAGLHSSAACTAPTGLLKPLPLVPPVTRTSPVGSRVALICRRANAIGAVYAQAGFGRFRATISAVLVGGAPPPAERILPGSYMPAEPQSRHGVHLREAPL